MKTFRKLVSIINRKVIGKSNVFKGSDRYWIERYDSGGNSGDGSYRKLAEFKAEVINNFVQHKKIRSVIEYGCGDGNQLTLAEYPTYCGFDISPVAISMCKETFSSDKTKSFYLMDQYEDSVAELTLSLDVVYHLIEDDVFEKYMSLLFDSSNKYVIIYASNTSQNSIDQVVHVKHRNFTHWIALKKPKWKLHKHIPNRYPFDGNNRESSFSDFYIFEKGC